jgi:hypothetical protein
VNVTDDQRLRQRLREEFGALEISPPPVLRVTSRGQGMRTRRRTLAIGGLALAVAGGVLSVHVTGGQKAAAPPAVRVSVPDPAAPGGVFASGTADGKPWKLAVRNIATAAPGTPWCLPAVMFNGRYGNVLYPVTNGAQAFGNPAYLADIPGFPGVGAIFTQVKPNVTKVIATLPGGRSLTVRPVRVSGCGGERFLLAGFAFGNAQGVPTMLTVEGAGFAEALGLAHPGVFGPTARGVWANTDKNRADIASSRGAQPIGTGTLAGMTWHVRTALGLFGQCYTATLRGPGGGRGQSADQCVPVAAPPHVVALDPVSIPGAATQLHGYAGLVNPGTARVVVSISNGASLTIRPVRWTGRAYIAFAVPPGCRVDLLVLYDAGGHLFATTTTLSRAG